MDTITKKIKITENQLQILINEVMKVGETPREQFIYYIEEIGKPGSITGSGNIEELYKNSMQGALDNYIERMTDDPSIDYTDDDIKELEEEFYNEHLHDSLLNNIEYDKTRNLINVYREISIPKTIDGYYNYLKQHLNGIGLPWAISYDDAKSYDSDFINGDYIIICGKVSPDSINWSYSISISTDVRENELRLLPNQAVEIYKIIPSTPGEPLLVNKSIIVSTGNSNKWESRYSENNHMINGEVLNEINYLITTPNINYVFQETSEPKINNLWNKKTYFNKLGFETTDYYTQKDGVEKLIMRVVVSKNKKSLSKYYKDFLNMRVVRWSNHWSWYIIKDYNLEKDPYDFWSKEQKINIIWGTEQPIGGKYYNLMLNDKWNKNLTKEVYNKNYKREIEDKPSGQKFKVMSGSLFNLKDNQYMAGSYKASNIKDLDIIVEQMCKNDEKLIF